MHIRNGSCFVRNHVFLKVLGKDAETGEFLVKILMPDRVLRNISFSRRVLSNPREYTKISAKETARYKSHLLCSLEKELKLEQELWGDKVLNLRSLKRRLKDIEEF